MEARGIGVGASREVIGLMVIVLVSRVLPVVPMPRRMRRTVVG